MQVSQTRLLATLPWLMMSCTSWLPTTFALLLSTTNKAFQPVSVTTRAVLPDQTPADVHQFLASPGNWPKIVSTSMGVSSANNNDDDLSKPLPVGKQVNEIFGLPPILPLSVQWTCTKSVLPSGSSSVVVNNNSGGGGGRIFGGIGKRNSSSKNSAGRLEFLSPEGLGGVAQNCEMLFDVQDKTTDNNESSNKGTEVSLDMKYEPNSILAILAVPILTIDNAVALKFLLPAAMRTQPELDKFRNLMGSLYLGAGLAHLADCIFGPSQLLIAAGAPAFDMLPFVGQVVALVWCVVGPLSFALSKFGGKGYADLGLILYGFVEVGAAGLVSLSYGAGDAGGLLIMNAFVNAILVQGVVAGAWFYSASREQ